MYVILAILYEKLLASDHRALLVAGCARRRPSDPVAVWPRGFLYAFIGMFMLMGIVKKTES